MNTIVDVVVSSIPTRNQSGLSSRHTAEGRTISVHFPCTNQRELVELKDDEASYFELNVCPTYDLYQSLLAQADQIEVIEPESVRKQMRNFAKNLMSYYKE